MLILSLIYHVFTLPLYICNWIYENNYRSDDDYSETRLGYVLSTLEEPSRVIAIYALNASKGKMSISRGTLIFLGILLEDVPQLVVSFLIENKIKSDNPNGSFSSTALANLLLSAFHILHKLAEAWDKKDDLQYTEYKAMKSFRAHGSFYLESWIGSLGTAGDDCIISSGGDGTVKLWKVTTQKNFKLDFVTRKCIQTFQCGRRCRDAVAVGDSKVIVCGHGKEGKSGLVVFDNVSGKEPKEIDLDWKPHFVSLHPDKKSFFTSGKDATCIQRIDVNTYETICEYPHPATSIDFLGATSFVSVCDGSNDVHVWDIDHNHEPLHTVQSDDDYDDDNQFESILEPKVLCMTPTSFLVSRKEKVQLWTMSDNVWTINRTFKLELTTSLVKISDKLFVSTRYNIAELWDISKKKKPLFTFRGHEWRLISGVYLSKIQAVATGDNSGIIKVWSVKKYLKNEEDETHEKEDETHDKEDETHDEKDKSHDEKDESDDEKDESHQ